jgi:hypothetical protein
VLHIGWGRIDVIRILEAEMEARKAEGASVTALIHINNPKPVDMVTCLQFK